MKNSNTKTVRDQINDLIEVRDGQVYPKKSDEIWERQKKESNPLDREYEQRTAGDYTRTDPGAGLTNEEDISQIEEGIGLFAHTDAIKVGNTVIEVPVAKTMTCVLDNQTESDTIVVSLSVNFARSDSADIESNIPTFIPDPVDLPRGREREFDDEKREIITTMPINGFNMSALMESIEDGEEKILTDIREALRGVAGYVMEKTVSSMLERQIPPEKIAKSQASVGLVPKARKRYEQIARGVDERGIPNPLTDDIKKAGREFANNLAEELGIIPLTGETLEILVSVMRIQTSAKPAVYERWTSRDRSYSYFTKGNVHGRIHRLASEGRRTPILQEGGSKEEVKKVLEKIIPIMVTLMENISRKQMNLPTIPYPDTSILKTYPRPKNKSIEDMEEFTGILTPIRSELEDKVAKALEQVKKDHDKATVSNMISEFNSLMTKLGMSDGEGTI